MPPQRMPAPFWRAATTNLQALSTIPEPTGQGELRVAHARGVVAEVFQRQPDDFLCRLGPGLQSADRIQHRADALVQQRLGHRLSPCGRFRALLAEHRVRQMPKVLPAVPSVDDFDDLHPHHAQKRRRPPSDSLRAVSRHDHSPYLPTAQPHRYDERIPSISEPVSILLAGAEMLLFQR